MNAPKAWVKALQISESEYQAWTKDLPKQQALTFWCLETGKLEEETYFNWAREHYGLPSLNEQFFKQPPNREFWMQIQSVANWSAQMIPIAQWDGIIYVACVEPSEDIRWSFPVCYILAHPQNLKHYWQDLMISQEKSFAGVPPTPDRQTSTSKVELATTGADEPAGLDLKKFAQTQAAPSTDYMEALAQQVGGTSSASTNAPENLNWNVSPATNSSTNDTAMMPDGINLNFTTPQPVLVPNDEKTNFIMLDRPTETRPSYTSILPRLRSEFVGVMVLDVIKDTAVPNCWDEKFNKTSASATKPIELNSPSIFRVAVRTKNPYLGQVVETATNSEFFKAWGFTEMPKILLVQPVIQNGNVTQLILGLCENIKKNHQHLRAGDKAVETFLKMYAAKSAA